MPQYEEIEAEELYTRRRATPKKAQDVPRKFTGMRLPVDLKQRVMVACVTSGVSFQEACTQALTAWVEEREKS